MINNTSSTSTRLMTNWRWWMCVLLFVATTVNYLDRQVLSLTWKDFIAPEFHWTDADYGTITAVFSLVYAVCMLFAGRFIDWMGTKKGYLWAIGVWSMGACMHALCGIATEAWVGLPDAAALRAVELKADAVFKGTTVDGVYDSDPHKNPDAKLIRDITYQEAIDRDLRVMDPSAFQLCKEQKLPEIRVFNMDDLGNIQRVAQGEAIGTRVHG